MRLGRPGSGWPGRWRRRRSSVWWRHRRGCCARPETGGRATPGTRCTWPSCWRWARCSAVAVPDEETEAARDLVRARDDVRGDLISARHRVTHLLLRQGIVYAGGAAWTGVHANWLRRQRFPRPALQWSYDAALAALGAAEDRRDRLDAAIAELAAGSRFTPIVDRLTCLRGIATLTGFGLAVEIGDWSRLSP